MVPVVLEGLDEVLDRVWASLKVFQDRVQDLGQGGSKGP